MKRNFSLLLFLIYHPSLLRESQTLKLKIIHKFTFDFIHKKEGNFGVHPLNISNQSNEAQNTFQTVQN